MKSKTMALVCLGLLLLPSLFFIFNEVIYPGHDSWIHARWHTVFAEQVWSGDIYPRWLSNLRFGSGSPVMFYYPPMSYYFISGLYFLFPGNDFFYLRINVAHIIIIITSFVTMVIFLKTLIPNKSSVTPIFGGLLYVAQPYFYLIDIYVRGAFAESWIFVIIPVIFLGIQIITRKTTLGFIVLSLGTFLLITTHIVSAVFWLPIIVLYILYKDRSKQKGKLIINLTAIFIGIGMSSAYLFTALSYQNYANLTSMYSYEKILSSLVFNTKRFSLAIDSGLTFSNMIFWISILTSLSIIGLLSFIKKIDSYIKFWIFISLVIVFLMSPISTTTWQLIPLLYKIQFSWRLLPVLSFVLILLYARTLETLLNRAMRRFFYSIPLILSIALPSTILVLGSNYINNGAAIDSYENIEKERLTRFNNKKVAYFTPIEYELVTTKDLLQYKDVNIVAPIQNDNPIKIHINSNTSRNIDVEIKTPEDLNVIFKRQNFYGTEITVNNEIKPNKSNN